jgi:hypothetical protein
MNFFMYGCLKIPPNAESCKLCCYMKHLRVLCQSSDVKPGRIQSVFGSLKSAGPVIMKEDDGSQQCGSRRSLNSLMQAHCSRAAPPPELHSRVCRVRLYMLSCCNQDSFKYGAGFRLLQDHTIFPLFNGRLISKP